MKAILVDPERQVIEEITTERGLEALRSLIGCRMLTVPVVFDNEDTLWADDEGLFVDPLKMVGSRWHLPDGAVFVFAGKLVILGSDDDGNSRDVQMSVQSLQEMLVQWMDPWQMYAYCERVGVI